MISIIVNKLSRLVELLVYRGFLSRFNICSKHVPTLCIPTAGIVSISRQTLGEFLPRNDSVSTTRVDTTGGIWETFENPFKLTGRLAAIEAAQLLPCLRR
mmetsp:Transcript_15059/g.17317  ORF Transcript_15059/g.17317 Transcript_15059/m.17317 type:complete len:100 (-) Transcript_15059:2833-3132(-)